MDDLDNKSKRLLDLQDMLVDFSEIERLIYLPDRKSYNRKENDTEHSFNLALCAWYLAQSFPHLDTNKIIRYALIHDLVELHAGDIQAIGRTKEQEKSKAIKEKEALEKLKKDWPDFQPLTEEIENYEAKKDPESKFVYALDKLMPMMLNMLSQGKTWTKYQFTMNSVISEKDTKVPLSPEVNEVWQDVKKHLIKNEEYYFKKHPKNELLYCTTSADKFQLGQRMCQKFGINLTQQKIEVDEIQSEDPKTLVAKKARAIYNIVQKPMIVSDDSWEIPELNGFPGPYMKSVNAWFGTEGWMKISANLTDKRIYLCSYVAYIDGTGLKIFTDQQERHFITRPSNLSHPAAILRCVTIPGETTSIVDINKNNPEKLLKGRRLWEEFCEWYLADHREF